MLNIGHNAKTPRRRGLYLLPNLFTTAALFAGFYAIVASIQGGFHEAAVGLHRPLRAGASSWF